MTASRPSDDLASRRYVVVIVRLLLDRRGRLVHGEAVDIEGRHPARFRRWAELTRAVRSLADRERPSTPASDQPDPDGDGLRLAEPVESGCPPRCGRPVAGRRDVAGRVASCFAERIGAAWAGVGQSEGGTLTTVLMRGGVIIGRVPRSVGAASVCPTAASGGAQVSPARRCDRTGPIRRVGRGGDPVCGSCEGVLTSTGGA